MSRFRLFLAWLVLAAIPLQGLAAASMLFCGTGEHHAQVRAAAVQEHDHSQHSHAQEVQVEESASLVSALPDAAHECGVCASCCHSVAIAEFAQLTPFAPLPRAQLVEPFVLIDVLPSQVPDRPPRA